MFGTVTQVRVDGKTEGAKYRTVMESCYWLQRTWDWVGGLIFRRTTALNITNKKRDSTFNLGKKYFINPKGKLNIILSKVLKIVVAYADGCGQEGFAVGYCESEEASDCMTFSEFLFYLTMNPFLAPSSPVVPHGQPSFYYYKKKNH